MKNWLLYLLPFCALLVWPSLLDHLESWQRPLPKVEEVAKPAEREQSTERNETSAR